MLGLTSTLNTDGAALNSAKQSGDRSKFVTAANTFVGDIQKLKTGLDSAEATATHSDVRIAIQNLDTDLASFDTGMQQVLSGNTSNETATTQAVNRLQSDGDAIDSLCGNVTNG